MASVHSNMALIKRQPRTSASDRSARRARRKFLSVFPKGFYDPDYLELERDYKWAAHTEWNENLSKSRFAALIKNGSFTEIAQQAVRIESKTNLLFSFEKRLYATLSGVQKAQSYSHSPSLNFSTVAAASTLASTNGSQLSGICLVDRRGCLPGLSRQCSVLSLGRTSIFSLSRPLLAKPLAGMVLNCPMRRDHRGPSIDPCSIS